MVFMCFVRLEKLKKGSNKMSSVTARIREVKQPRGGYLKPSAMMCVDMNDGNVLSEKENLSPSIVGMAVDYLTRFMMTSSTEKAFQVSRIGAGLAEKHGREKAVEEAEEYLSHIRGIDDESIVNACKLVTFDVWVRAPKDALLAKTAKETNPDSDTIRNIQIMVKRSLEFWKTYGPIVDEGFDFGPYGYSSVVDTGDGDYLTKDTLWDFKVSKEKPKSKNTLQLLMYWIMGKHSEKDEFKFVTNIGLFNPRLNLVYTYDARDIPDATIAEIEEDVICY